MLIIYSLGSCTTANSIENKCPDIETDLSNLGSSGTLILDGDETYQMDMDSRVKMQVNKAGDNFYYFAVSPEHNWISYISRETDELVIVGGSNKIIKTIPWEEDWAYAEWLNEEQLIIDLIQKDENFHIVSKFLLLNPFTNERYFFDANYPEVFYDYWWRIIEYNGNFDQVVYLQGISGPFYYTLWDMTSNTALVQLNPVGDLHVRPVWASDGSQFVISLSNVSKVEYFEDFPSYEIFKVSRDGIITQLTHFSDTFPWIYVTNLSMAPDKRFIAFWFSYWNDVQPFFGDLGDRYLGILDLTTGITTTYCIRGEIDIDLGNNKYSPPLWSPDSKQIVFRSQIGEHYVLDSQTILLDVYRNQAFLIGEALEPVGWLKSP